MVGNQKKSISVFCICGLGDIICTLPGLIELQWAFPEAKITLIANEKPVLDFLYILENKFELIDLSEWPIANTLKKLSFLMNINNEKFDVAFSRAQPNTYKVPLLVWATWAKRKIGGTNEKLSFIYDELLPINFKDTHRIDVFLKLASSLIGKEISFDTWEKFSLRFRLNSAQSNGLQEIKSINGTKTIILSPGSDTKNHGKWSPVLKRWPAHHYRAIVELLVKSNITVLVIGGPRDIEETSMITSGFGYSDGVYNVCGKTNLSDLIRLIKKSDGVIAHDSGIAHLTTILSKPLITLFGPTSPHIFGPRGEEVRLIWGEKECRGCFPEPTCSGNHCEVMINITPEEVLKELFIVIGYI
jgi:ADP-heptose:LPS heptosyltransferase